MEMFDPEKTNPDIRPPVEHDRGAETREFHEDILRMVDRLNRETIDVMPPDGFVRTDMKVRTIERARQGSAEEWYITLFDPANPDSEQDTLRMTLGDFMKSRVERVVEQ